MALDLDPTFGAMFIGLLFATFFQGVLTLQTYIYYEKYPEDFRLTKILVGAIWILDMVHLVLISHTTYHYLVRNWGNEEALLYATQELDLHLTFVGVATILCQAFYLHRLWIFSEGNYLLIIFLVFGCLSTLILDISMTVMISQGDKSVASFNMFGHGIIAMFAISAAFDLIIAGLLCYYLKQRKSGFKRTNSLVSTVIQYAIGTGLLTSVVALMCLVAYVIRPNSFIFIAIHFSLGRMYTNALLATLNSRGRLREHFSHSVNDSLPVFNAAGITSKTHELTGIRRERDTDYIASARSSCGGNKSQHACF